MLERINTRAFSQLLVPSIHFHGRHLLAAFNTFVAGINTALHDWIIMEQRAAFGTSFAGSSANAARLGMQCRSAQHEIGAEVTEFGAVHHRANVFNLCMCASTV
jgi:hypothetical protein